MDFSEAVRRDRINEFLCKFEFIGEYLCLLIHDPKITLNYSESSFSLHHTSDRACVFLDFSRLEVVYKHA